MGSALGQIFSAPGVFQLPVQRLQRDFGKFLMARTQLDALANSAPTTEDRQAAQQLLGRQLELEGQVPIFLRAVDTLQSQGFSFGATLDVTKFTAQMESHLGDVEKLIARAGGVPESLTGFEVPLTWPWLIGGGLILWMVLRRL